MATDPNKRADYYNTGYIISRLARDRHRALVRFCVVLGVLCVLVAGFFTLSSYQSLKHPTPAARPMTAATPLPSPPASPRPAVASPLPPGAVPAPNPASPPVEPAKPSPSGPTVRVKLMLAKPGAVRVDGNEIGKGRELEVRLLPGVHEIAVKIGAKSMAQSIVVEQQAPLLVFFNPRKGHPVVMPMRKR